MMPSLLHYSDHYARSPEKYISRSIKLLSAGTSVNRKNVSVEKKAIDTHSYEPVLYHQSLFHSPHRKLQLSQHLHRPRDTSHNQNICDH